MLIFTSPSKLSNYERRLRFYQSLAGLRRSAELATKTGSKDRANHRGCSTKLFKMAALSVEHKRCRGVILPPNKIGGEKNCLPNFFLTETDFFLAVFFFFFGGNPPIGGQF